MKRGMGFWELTSGRSGTVNVGRPLVKFPKPASEPHAASENSSPSTSAARRWALRSWLVGFVVENLSTKLFMIWGVWKKWKIVKFRLWKGWRGFALLRVMFYLARYLINNSEISLSDHSIKYTVVPEVLWQIWLIVLRVRSCCISQRSLINLRVCTMPDFPWITTTILEVHKDEVWNIQWSHNGAYLASASRDKSAIIWRRGVSVLCLEQTNLNDHLHFESHHLIPAYHHHKTGLHIISCVITRTR